MTKQRRATKRKSAVSKKTATPVDIAPLVRHAQLRYLRLRKSESSLIAVPEKPPELNQTINIEVGPGGGDTTTVSVQLTFTLDGPNMFNIRATFAILYEYDTTDEISPEQMAAFGNVIGVNNAWPYWREFVQSITSRMGFPSLTLPFLRIDSGGPPVIESKRVSKSRKTKRPPAKKKRKKV
ncbi:MAG: protein-export chaperone SecB [Planctomycetes bacterium]|nr:protein-export chaperone SecB [Planctomycetota bacterium]